MVPQPSGTSRASSTAGRGKVNYGNNVPKDRPSLRRDAQFIRTDKGLYRMRLDREWCTYQRLLVCIGLNPSTAGATEDDATIRAMYGHCDAWDLERLVMINLFTLVATDPDEMKAHPYPEVAGSIEVWQKLFGRPEPMTVVAAWGRHGTHQDQDLKAMRWLRYFGIAPLCLGINKDGTPLHPLYVKRGVPLLPYDGR